jgi:hypothetical protein
MQRSQISTADGREPREGKSRTCAEISKEPLQVRIPQEVKRRFKAHAAMQGIAPHELFVQVWEYYERTHR